MSRLDQLTRMWEADQSDADVPYMIAQEHARQGEHERAIEWYERCIGIDPEYHYAYFHEARSLESLGRKTEASQTARRGLDRAKQAENAKATEELTAYLEVLDAG